MALISTAGLLPNEVKRIGSICKAAERLKRRSLNQKAHQGIQLSERFPRGMHLTADGEVLVSDIRLWSRCKTKRAETKQLCRSISDNSRRSSAPLAHS